MQVGSALSLSPSFSSNRCSGDGFAEISGKFCYDFVSKMKLEEESLENQLEKEQELSKEQELEEREEEGEEGEEEEEEEEDFSFVCLNPEGSPVSADDAFLNGQIRPVFPLFNQDLLFADADDGVSPSKSVDGTVPLRPPLRKLFVEGHDSTSSSLEPDGPYCEWKGKTVEDASPVSCKKSNSTGFSKLWRFRDFVHRSNSDGKDAFFFLNHSPPTKTTVEKNEKPKVNPEKEKPKKVKGSKASASAAEKHYVKGKAIREVEKRKSYLPYRQDLVGFFTNVNGFSRNVHPF
ncbi:hypothetical protein SLE2022_045880 [Rubroshorea leprosula]